MSTDDVLRQARKMADEQFAFLNKKQPTIESMIMTCSMRPKPGTDAGKAWVDGARQAWRWAEARRKEDLEQRERDTIERCARMLEGTHTVGEVREVLEVLAKAIRILPLTKFDE